MNILFNQKIHKHQAISEIHEDLEFDESYFVQLFFSTIIACFGMLLGSTAVVIGAMIIAPIFMPILGLSVGILTTRDRTLQRSMTVLAGSISMVLLLTFILTIFTPIRETNPEILSRTNPTILDLFIALSSAVLGVLSYFYEKIGKSIAGVAISISLLPPLVASGIGLAFRDFEIFSKALILFGANTSAIIFAGIVTLYILKVRPHREEEQTRFRIGVVLSSISILAISIPLTVYFTASIQETTERRLIIDTLNSQITSIHPEAEFEDLSVTFNDPIEVSGTLLLPEQVALTLDQESAINQSLVDEVGRSLELKFNVVNKLLVQKTDTLEQERQEISNLIRDQIALISPNIFVDKVTILENESGGLEIDVLLRLSGELQFTFDNKLDLEEDVESALGRQVRLDIAFTPITELREQSPEAILTTNLRQELREIISQISTVYIVNKVEITPVRDTAETNANRAAKPLADLYTVDVEILAPPGDKFTPEDRALIESTLESQNSVDLNFQYRYLLYER